MFERRIGLAAAAIAATLAFGAHVPPAQAFSLDGPSGKAPWCGQTPGSGFDCSFYTFEQCRDFIRGVAAFCIRNTMVPEAPPPRPRRHRS